MKRFLTGIFFITLSTSSFGQSSNNLIVLIDSLRHELEFAQEDTVRADILLQISENFLYSDPDSTIYYGEKAFDLAKKGNYIQIQIGALGFIGNALIYKGNLPEALQLGFKAIEMAKDVPVVVRGIGPTMENMGRIYFEIGDYEKALHYFKTMVAFGESDRVGEAWGYYGISRVYEKQNKFDSAISNLDESSLIFNAINYSSYQNVYDFYPGWYMTRARIYLKQQKSELALLDLFTALKMALMNGQVYHMSNTYNEISSYYKNMNEQDSAIFYAEKGLELAKKVSNTNAVLASSEILAEAYESRDPQKALYYLKLAVETRNKLYGAGNIQIMRDMITQNEKKQIEIEAARIENRNRIRMNSMLGSLFTLIIIAIFLIRNNRVKQKAKQKIESAFDQLKATQSQLIQSEKMASLGELTAGIAHEIQNPLNFVNNFSEVSKELAEELKEEAQKPKLNANFISEIAGDIADNQEKIYHHGQRASGIVKGMLEHSRTSDGKKEPTDLNALADEYLRLAYHGLRAKDKSFNADFKTDLDESLPKVKVVPQDIGRVLLNLINNAFYAVDKKAKSGIEGFKPEVIVSTKTIDDKIEISVKDNGEGIPEQVRDKIFQPFFTTKPTGSGTGLGLSLSYDIITKGHGGKLKVDSIANVKTEFTITLPNNL